MRGGSRQVIKKLWGLLGERNGFAFFGFCEIVIRRERDIAGAQGKLEEEQGQVKIKIYANNPHIYSMCEMN